MYVSISLFVSVFVNLFWFCYLIFCICFFFWFMFLYVLIYFCFCGLFVLIYLCFCNVFVLCFSAKWIFRDDTNIIYLIYFFPLLISISSLPLIYQQRIFIFPLLYKLVNLETRKLYKLQDQRKQLVLYIRQKIISNYNADTIHFILFA